MGDGLEGHELWQHSNLKEYGYATTRFSSDASKNNIVIALSHNDHVDVNAAQYALNTKTQAPIDNIIANAEILYNHPKVPNSQVDIALSRAQEHMNNVISQGGK